VPDRPRAHLGAIKNDFIGEFLEENEDTIKNKLKNHGGKWGYNNYHNGDIVDC